MNTPQQPKEIQYPVSFDLKVIMGVAHSKDAQIEAIEKVLTGLDIPFKNWRHKQSGKGNFISHTVNVHIDSQSLMHNLYTQLKTIPDIKMAL